MMRPPKWAENDTSGQKDLRRQHLDSEESHGQWLNDKEIPKYLLFPLFSIFLGKSLYFTWVQEFLLTYFQSNHLYRQEIHKKNLPGAAHTRAWLCTSHPILRQILSGPLRICAGTAHCSLLPCPSPVHPPLRTAASWQHPSVLSLHPPVPTCSKRVPVNT